MKYDIIHIILPILIGMACATSCSSDPDSDVLDYEKGEELKFEVADGSTRATTITTTKNLTDQPFMLFGDVNRKAESMDHSGLRTLFEQVKVTYVYNKDKKASNWEYDVKQYWHMGQEHSFVAIHPYDIPGISNLTYQDCTVNFTYSMPEEDEDIKDIVVATHRRNYNLDSDKSGPVRFRFQHLFTKINLAPALDQDEEMFPADDETKKDIEFGYDLIRNEFIQIRKVELYGFSTKADISITPATLSNSNQTDERTVSIVEDKTAINDTISFYFDEKISKHIFNDKKYVKLLEDTDAIMLIPQKFGKKAQIKFGYTVNTDNTEPEELRYVIVPLESETLERGISYLLKFTITDVYKGQIKKGSIKWEQTDISDTNAGHNWINDTGTICKEFGDEDDPNDSENSNDNEDEE